ncbi:hypothetical protein HDU93_003622, partial [Gonapodya sp. JEL0774]
AEHFADGKFLDELQHLFTRKILYGVPISPDKLDQLYKLSLRVDRLGVLVDSIEAAEWLETYANNAVNIDGRKWNCWIKVDTGYHRAGVPPVTPTLETRLLPLLRHLTSHVNLRFAGLYSHAGHSYDPEGPSAVTAIAHQDRDAMRQLVVAVRKQLFEWGVAENSWDVAVGSTPIALDAARSHKHDAESWHGISELHPGNYPFLDLQQLRYSGLPLHRAAAHVMTRVLAHYLERSEMLVDAGSLALSKDSAPYTLPDGSEMKNCYGALASHPHLYLRSCSQEVSVVAGLKPADFQDPRLFPGQLVHIIPAHCCLAAGCFPAYAVVKDNGGDDVLNTWGDQIEEVWVKAAGW